MTTHIRKARQGFALPVVLIALFLLTGALASGFAMLRGERSADDASLQQDAAIGLAEAGLQQGLNNRTGMGLAALPTGTDSARITLSGGYADVVTTVLRAPVGNTVPGLYYVRSRGVRTQTGVSGAGNAVATASSFATYNVITLTVKSAMTGINGINKAGSAGLISGHDQCGAKSSLPAAAVPKNPGMTGSGQWLNSLSGSKKIDTLGLTRTEVANMVGVDWDAIVNDGAITPQFDIPSGGTGFPNQTWFNNNPTSWPTIIVRNGPFGTHPTFPLPVDSGRGLLIVFGDLRFNGGSSGWKGIILVGGRLVSNGGQSIDGAIISGLNEQLGIAVEENDVEVNNLNGTKNYNYNSCWVTNALMGSGGNSLRPYRSTFSNSFPTW